MAAIRPFRFFLQEMLSRSSIAQENHGAHLCCHLSEVSSLGDSNPAQTLQLFQRRGARGALGGPGRLGYPPFRAKAFFTNSNSSSSSFGALPGFTSSREVIRRIATRMTVFPVIRSFLEIFARWSSRARRST